MNAVETLEEVQENVVGKLLQEPELIMLHDVQESWFSNPQHKQVVETLKQREGNFEDLVELVPDTSYSESDLQMISYAGFNIENFESNLIILKNEYLNNRFLDATVAYANNPTKRNKNAALNRMKELDSESVSDEKGDLILAAEEIEHYLENEEEEGIKTFSQYDRLLGGGMAGGMLVVIGARPSVGKTAYGINMAIQALIKQPNAHIDFFTLEMTQRQMMHRFISEMTDINSYKFRNPNLNMTDEEKNKVKDKLDYLLHTNLKIYSNSFDIDSIDRTIRKNQHQVDGEYIAFIDYLGLVGTARQDIPRYLQVGEITRRLKLLTNKYDIPIVLFSQLNRSVEGRQSKQPNLSDLRESGDIEQDANVVGFLYEDEEEEERRYLHIAKNREGRTGTINYRFHGSSMHFEEE